MFSFNSIIKNRPLLMGIVNVTPDSFSDGGKYFDTDSAVRHALMLIDDGADIIDIGAQSTRPGYSEVSPDEEKTRLSGVIKALRAKTDITISVDTYFPEVAEFALKCGADIINDVSGSWNTDMAEIVRNGGAGWIIMHNGAGSVDEVKAFFEDMAQKCDEFGIKKEQLCFDMGIGFGKSYEENLELIANIDLYKKADYPLLLGVSRKRVIGKGSGQEKPDERVYGNIAADTAAIFGGADIIRLHDVKNEKQGILMASELKSKRRK
ncbi:MAG: dihydropteroate synthase [Eubacterium sp.]|nr:dihydropteroate synthase [Eubacterium sp.]